MVIYMKKNELFFPSADKMTNIHMVMWEPDDEVLGVVNIVHGVTEHIMRYENFAQFLTNHGIAVVGIDLLGHGLSTNNGTKKMYFGGVGSWNYVLEDIEKCLINSKEMYSGVPCTMLGFSLGSFLARTYLINRPGIVDGAILVGTGYNSPLEISLARSVVKSETKKYGDANATDKIRDLTFGTYNKKFKPNRTEYDWLCSSNEMLDQYISDPLRGGVMSVGLFREMLYGIEYTGDRKNIKRMHTGKPILLLSGSKDPVGAFGNGVNKVYKEFQRVGISDVTMRLYEGLRHDILHEDSRDVIYDDILNWMKARKLVNDKKIYNKIDSVNVSKNEENVDIGKKLADSDEVESVLNNANSKELKKSL